MGFAEALFEEQVYKPAAPGHGARHPPRSLAARLPHADLDRLRRSCTRSSSSRWTPRARTAPRRRARGRCIRASRRSPTRSTTRSASAATGCRSRRRACSRCCARATRARRGRGAPSRGAGCAHVLTLPRFAWVRPAHASRSVLARARPRTRASACWSPAAPTRCRTSSTGCTSRARIVPPGRRRGTARHPRSRRRARAGRARHAARAGGARRAARGAPVARDAPLRSWPRRRSATWARSAATCASTRAARTTTRRSSGARRWASASRRTARVCHVVPQGKRCVAAHSSDVAPVLIALGAEVEIASAGGPAHGSTWTTSSSATASTTTCCGPGELVTRVRVPGAARSGLRSALPEAAPARRHRFPDALGGGRGAAARAARCESLRVVVGRARRAAAADRRPRRDRSRGRARTRKRCSPRSPRWRTSSAARSPTWRTTPTGGTRWCRCS